MRFLWLCMRYVSLLLLCTVTVSFVLSNDMTVALSLFPFPYEITVPAYALAAFCILCGLFSGLAIGSIYSSGKIRRLRREARTSTAKLRALEQEVTALRLETQARTLYPLTRESSSAAFLPRDVVNG